MNIDSLTSPDILKVLIVRATGDDRWNQLDAPRLIAGGKSNLTFEISSPAGELILRRPPTGQLVPRAHDMGREARVQRALFGSGVPVAQIVLDETGPHSEMSLGVPFYVMEKVPGVVIVDSLPAGFATSDQARVELVDALTDTLAALHAVDPDEIGIGDYGRPEGFVERQVRTWTSQARASATDTATAVDALADRLADHTWKTRARSIVHGDYRIDNCIFDTVVQPQINAVIDWELSTIGDPLTDLAMLLTYWVEAGEAEHALTPNLTSLPGFPDREHIIERYSRQSGQDLSDLPAYLAFTHLKLAGILQGVARRVSAGQMAGQDFGDLDAEIERIASQGLNYLKQEK